MLVVMHRPGRNLAKDVLKQPSSMPTMLHGSFVDKH